jgi:hypothetical protein
MSYPRMVNTINLGMPNTHHWTYHTHGLHTSILFFLCNIRFSHKRGASVSSMLSLHNIHVSKTIINKVVVAIKMNIKLYAIKEKGNGNNN